MCTATWLFNENGYDLFFNRDELNTRKIATPPKLFSTENIHYISPVDADEGGTWIAVNEFGLSICLLNFYHHSQPISIDKKYISRGLLIPKLISSENSESVLAKLKSTNLENYRPFILAIFDKGKSVSSFTRGNKNGLPEIQTNVELPLCSSSFKSLDVIQTRTEFVKKSLQNNENPTAELLKKLHRSHHPKKSAYSICMHRDDAHTVSSSHIKVSDNSIDFYYTNGNPCEGISDLPVSIIQFEKTFI